MTKPKPDDDDSPKTYFEHARRSTGAKPGDPVPKLPASNPWAADPCGDEPLIDRREDSDNTTEE
jgi:hypothetical protein